LRNGIDVLYKVITTIWYHFYLNKWIFARHVRLCGGESPPMKYWEKFVVALFFEYEGENNINMYILYVLGWVQWFVSVGFVDGTVGGKIRLGKNWIRTCLSRAPLVASCCSSISSISSGPNAHHLQLCQDGQVYANGLPQSNHHRKSQVATMNDSMNTATTDKLRYSFPWFAKTWVFSTFSIRRITLNDVRSTIRNVR